MKIIVTESQFKTIVESNVKLKNYLLNNFGIDFAGKIHRIRNPYDVPTIFYDYILSGTIRRYLNFWQPMYHFEFDGVKYLYQTRNDYEWFMDDKGNVYVDNEIPERLGINVMGFNFSDMIDLYYGE